MGIYKGTLLPGKNASLRGLWNPSLEPLDDSTSLDIDYLQIRFSTRCFFPPENEITGDLEVTWDPNTFGIWLGCLRSKGSPASFLSGWAVGGSVPFGHPPWEAGAPANWAGSIKSFREENWGRLGDPEVLCCLFLRLFNLPVGVPIKLFERSRYENMELVKLWNFWSFRSFGNQNQCQF